MDAGIAFHKPITPEELVDTVGAELPASFELVSPNTRPV